MAERKRLGINKRIKDELERYRQNHPNDAVWDSFELALLVEKHINRNEEQQIVADEIAKEYKKLLDQEEPTADASPEEIKGYLKELRKVANLQKEYPEDAVANRGYLELAVRLSKELFQQNGKKLEQVENKSPIIFTLEKQNEQARAELERKRKQ